MSIDENIATIQEGQSARIIRSQTEEHLLEREDEIISQLVQEYRAGTLTNDKMRGSIGEIAAMQDFRSHLESKIRRGLASAEKELGTNG